MFEFTNADFETGVPEIDDIEEFGAYQYELTMDAAVEYIKGEIVTQTHENYIAHGEVMNWKPESVASPKNILHLAHVGNNTGAYRSLTATLPVVGTESGATATPTLVRELQEIQPASPGGADGTVDSFSVSALEFLDFSETNPFGGII